MVKENGPCLCGDPLCPRCFPGAREHQAAMDVAHDLLEELETDDILPAVMAGICSIRLIRRVDAEREAGVDVPNLKMHIEEPEPDDPNEGLPHGT